MFGYLRFFLATLVLLSHLGITFYGANPGVAAVVIFYILAGFVVSSLFSKVFISKTPVYLAFYYERALRIFPQYIFIVILTLLFLFLTKYGSPKYELTALLNNLLVIPLNYYMLLENSILQEPKWWLVPPAWSLGVELQAYLVLPLIIYFKPVKIAVAILSLGVFFVANLAYISTDFFGYRLLPGVLFIFILGLSIYRNTSQNTKADLFDKFFPVLVYITMIVLLITLAMLNILHSSDMRETIMGILIGIPIVTHLAKSKIKLPMNHFLGDLSYGMFLSHFLAIWILEYYSFIDKSTEIYLYSLTVFLISLLISLVGVLSIEKNIKKYRFKLSKKILNQVQNDRSSP